MLFYSVDFEPIFTDLGHGIHRSRAWQFLLIFNTVGAVYSFYSTFDSMVSPGSDVHCRVDCIIQMINSWTGVIMYMMTCGELIGHRWIPPHEGQWRGVLICSLIWAWIKGWANNGDLRRHRAHYDVIVMTSYLPHPSMVCNSAHQRFCWWCHYIRDH